MTRRRLIIALLFAALAIVAWLLYRPVTHFPGEKKVFFLSSDDTTIAAIRQVLTDSLIINDHAAFPLLTRIMQLEKRIKPGKYTVRKGMSLLGILRMLQKNEQTPVKLVINKFRTPEQLAGYIGKRMECDSVAMLTVLEDSAMLGQMGLDSNTWMTAIIPNTYEFYWTTSPEQIFRRFSNEQKKFWTADRLKKASEKNFNPLEIYILASIVEEETNANEEKDTIASVYINRIHIGMPLQADPTVKFGLNDFALKRIYQKHLAIASPYNTYQHAGLPPGPICTPSIATLDAVLNAPATPYLYFVAKSNFSGRHTFSAAYEEHLKKASDYQKALNAQQKIREARLNTNKTP